MISDKELIKKYIGGNCTQQEIVRVKTLLREQTGTELLDELLSEGGNPITASYEAADAQMQTWAAKIDRKISDDQKNTVSITKRRPYLQYAAILIIVLLGAGIGELALRKNASRPVVLAYTERFNPNGKRSMITLSDSSTVYLGSGSRLRFPEHFVGNTREIDLEGEAFFEIAHNKQKPFIIHTGSVQTKVLGTSFKITAFKGQAFNVGVATGKVRVDRLIGKYLQSIAVLTPGRQVTYANGETVQAAIEVNNVKEWKEGHLVHTEKSLRTIAAELERWYDVDIRFSDPKKATMLMDVNITANVSIDKVLKVLGASGNFKYKITGKTITIY